jgi:hypothetical protein
MDGAAATDRASAERIANIILIGVYCLFGCGLCENMMIGEPHVG